MRSRRFAQPYPAREALYWVVKQLAGPLARPAPFAPAGRDVVLNSIVPRLSVAFVGDVLPPRRRTVTLAPEVTDFLRAADRVVANLEGPVVSRRVGWVFMGQAHRPDIVDLLARLAPPERVVLICANNHAADYGRRAHEESLAFLRRQGFTCVGDRSAPATALASEVSLAVGTTWSNQAQDFLASIPDAPPAGAALRILSPHWGYELEPVPRRSQIRLAARWTRRWDAIVGHHSHAPQPVEVRTAGGFRRPIAYSLGNFTFAYDLPRHRHGRMLRLDLGPTPGGAWAVGRMQWAPVVLEFGGRDRLIVSMDFPA